MYGDYTGHGSNYEDYEVRQEANGKFAMYDTADGHKCYNGKEFDTAEEVREEIRKTVINSNFMQCDFEKQWLEDFGSNK